MRIVRLLLPMLFCALPLAAQTGSIPEGFTPIFNGKDLTGWHVSKTSHHGTTPDFRVMHGLIVGTQNPRGGGKGSGGILLTDKKYKNFEIYMEVWPDYGCDSGLFLRSNEAGQAYQVMLDYLPGGGMGGVYGEGIKLGGQGGMDLSKLTAEQKEQLLAKMKKPSGPAPWEKVWKKGEWNSVRARMEGTAPHIQVWINGEQVTDFKDTANHAADGITEGMIAIQIHYSGEMQGMKFDRWVDGGFWRWRNIAIRELPD